MEKDRSRMFMIMGILLVLLLFAALFMGRGMSFNLGNFFEAEIGEGAGIEPVVPPTVEEQEEPVEVPPTDVPPTDTPAPQAGFSSHDDGARTGQLTALAGSFANLPDGYDLWLYVYDADDNSYQLLLLPQSADGVWSMDVEIGGKGNNFSGLSFGVGLLLADDDASASIIANDFELPVLPAGVEVLQEITLVRE